MKLKKCNAVLGLLTIILLLVHAGFEMYAFIRFIYSPVVTKVLGSCILVALLCHVITGMSIMMFSNDGTEIGKYSGLNRDTIIQRASAIGILVFLFGHLNAFSIMNSHIGGAFSLILALVFHGLFFGCAFLHIGTSLSKALITLGVLESLDTKKKMDRVVRIILAIAFIAIMVVISKTFIMLWSAPQ